MPVLWKLGMVVLIVSLALSMAIAIVRLATTPTEIVGAGFHGLHAHHRAGQMHVHGGHVHRGDVHHSAPWHGHRLQGAR